MTDVGERLRRVSERLTPPDRAFERLLEREARKRRHGRVAAATVALVVAFAVIGGGLTLLSGLIRERVEPGSGGKGQVNPRLVLDPGEYFYLGIRSSEATDGWIRDEETWWALDGSEDARETAADREPVHGHPHGASRAGTHVAYDHDAPARLFERDA